MAKILFVDDDASILAAFQRQFRKKFAIETAVGPEQGIAALESGDGFGVVVADMNMPGMNGIEFLRETERIQPEAVRLMLTGNADQYTAISAVNEGHIFRFLTKPCPSEALEAAIEAGLRQHELIVSERELLEKTLNGCVQALSEIIALIEPRGFGRSRALRETALLIASDLSAEKPWEIEMAAMLSLIGNVAIPAELALKARLGHTLSETEQRMVDRTCEIGGQLLSHIPRLNNVSRIVRYRDKHFDGTGFPVDDVAGEKLPFGARVLKAAADLCHLEAAGLSRADAVERMRSRKGWYDPAVLEATATAPPPAKTPGGASESESAAVTVKGLAVGQELLSDVESVAGVLVVAAGNLVTPALLERLRNFALLNGVKEPIHVRQLPRVETLERRSIARHRSLAGAR